MVDIKRIEKLLKMRDSYIEALLQILKEIGCINIKNGIVTKGKTPLNKIDVALEKYFKEHPAIDAETLAMENLLRDNFIIK